MYEKLKDMIDPEIGLVDTVDNKLFLTYAWNIY